jgi:hypothetical protein
MLFVDGHVNFPKSDIGDDFFVSEKEILKFGRTFNETSLDCSFLLFETVFLTMQK